MLKINKVLGKCVMNLFRGRTMQPNATSLIMTGIRIAILLAIVSPAVSMVTCRFTTQGVDAGYAYAAVRTATYVVAANNASAQSKLEADYVCDGIADDVEIQAAIEALPAGGGDIRLSEGTFYIASTILWTKGGVYIKGAGLDVTILKMVNNANTNMFQTGSTYGTNRQRIGLFDMTLDGNYANQSSGKGIDGTGLVYFTLSHMKLISFKDEAIYATSSANRSPYYTGMWYFDNFSVSDSGRLTGDHPAINIGGPSLFGMFWNKCDISYNPYKGLVIQSYENYFDEISFDGNNSDSGSSGQAANAITGGARYVFHKCYFSNRSYSIYILGLSNVQVTFSGCHFFNRADMGNAIQLVGLTSHVIITDNMFQYDVSGSAIYFENSGGNIPANISVRGNHFVGFPSAPITGSLTGTGNIIRDNDGYVTENSGTATVASGTTSVNVTHGLAAAPTRVVLTPTSDNNTRRYWVSAKGATTFTITISSSYTSAITFDWHATVGEQ